MNIEESLELLEANGVKVILTPEQREARRARRIARRERKKMEDADKRFYAKARRDHMTADYKSEPKNQTTAKPIYLKIFQKSGDVGGGWWVEKPGKPEYQAFKDLETLKKYFGSDTESLINGARLDYEDGEAGGPGWKVRVCDPPEIPDEVLEKLNKDLEKGVSMSHHSREW